MTEVADDSVQNWQKLRDLIMERTNQEISIYELENLLLEFGLSNIDNFVSDIAEHQLKSVPAEEKQQIIDEMNQIPDDPEFTEEDAIEIGKMINKGIKRKYSNNKNSGDYTKLVVDANIVIAAIIRQSTTRKIIEKSSLELFAPMGLIDELASHQDIILVRSSLTEIQYEYLKERMLKLIHLVRHTTIRKCEAEAYRQIGHQDLKDIIYVATVLCTNADGIWTNDTDFNVTDVDIYSTTDILHYFNLQL